MAEEERCLILSEEEKKLLRKAIAHRVASLGEIVVAEEVLPKKLTPEEKAEREKLNALLQKLAKKTYRG